MTARKKFQSTEEISAAISTAQADIERLRDKQAAVDEAETAASRAVSLAILREAGAGQAFAYNHARSEAQDRLKQLAGAPEFDVAALLQAFIDFKFADARCGANGSFSSQLDMLDPLPNNRLGVQQTREQRSKQLYKEVSWSEYLDSVINDRVEVEGKTHWRDLHSAANEASARAAEDARTAILAMGDYERLEVERPPAIADLHQQAVDQAQLDPTVIAAGGEESAKRLVHREELGKLIDQGM